VSWDFSQSNVRNCPQTKCWKPTVKTNLLVIANEVYKHLVFDSRHHLPILTFPGMAQGTVTVSSVAKMFNCTGCKIGWACRLQASQSCGRCERSQEISELHWQGANICGKSSCIMKKKVGMVPNV